MQAFENMMNPDYSQEDYISAMALLKKQDEIRYTNDYYEMITKDYPPHDSRD